MISGVGVRIHFLGAASTVTGSKFLVEHGSERLLVDCGLFQGLKDMRLRNWQPLPPALAHVPAIVLTHAHLDHSGALPLLVRLGFHGKVHTTPGTKDLCAILLPDSGHIQEEDAAFANRHGFSKHHPAMPLYTRLDAMASLKHLAAHPFHARFEPLPGWQLSFHPAGHILGAASVLIEVAGRRILFSGDLGRPNDPVMLPPEAPPAADTLVIESTYGNRQHPNAEPFAELGPALVRACARGATVVAPVFAVGRAQAVLHELVKLKAAGAIPRQLPVFLDSPMAVRTTQLIGAHPQGLRLDAADLQAMAHAATMVETPDQSKALARRHGPMLILAASGMATGGRVLHHLKRIAPDHRNMIILTGHQAEGTRGAKLASGAPTIRIHGEDVKVRAEVVNLESASAHADADQLLAWARRMPQAPQQTYVVHGQPESSQALRDRFEQELGWRAVVPALDSVWPS